MSSNRKPLTPPISSAREFARLVVCAGERVQTLLTRALPSINCWRPNDRRIEQSIPACGQTTALYELQNVKNPKKGNSVSTEGDQTAYSLPIEQDGEFSWKQALAPIVACLLSVVVLNAAMFRSGTDGSFEITILSEKWRLAQQRDDNVQWIVVGDSAGLHGVDPAVLTEALSGKAVNLCTFGTLLIVDDFWILEEYLKHNNPPQGVIVIHAPDVWPRIPQEAFFHYTGATPVAIHRVLEDLGPSVTRDHYISLFRKRYLPIYQAGKLFKRILRSQLGMVNQKADSWTMKNGHLFLDSSYAQPREVKGESETYCRLNKDQSPMAMSAVNANTMRQIIRLGEERSFSIWVANAPIAETVKHTGQVDRYFAAIRSELKRLDKQHSHFHYVLDGFATFAPDEMQSCDHIVGAAVKEYSRILSSTIRE